MILVIFETGYRAAHIDPSFHPEVEVSMRRVLKKASHQSHTIPQARIAVYGATSSPIGQLNKMI